MTKNIRTVYVALTNAQVAMLPNNLIKTAGNKKYLMIQDLKSVASLLINESLVYADVKDNAFTTIPVPSGLPVDASIGSLYHIIPSNIIAAFNKFEDGGNLLNVVQTIDSRWVCAFNTLYEFWDLFGSRTIKLVQLDYNNFPHPVYSPGKLI